MNDGQIESLMGRDPIASTLFQGVFAADTLPHNPPIPCALIANTDPENRPGQHWVAFYIESNGHGEYFDSYGRPPTVKNFRDFLQQNTSEWTCNDSLLQGVLSSTCGQYCIFYLLFRCRDVSMQEIVAEFNVANRASNDVAVNNFLSDYFNVDLNAYDVGFLTKQIAQILQE